MRQEEKIYKAQEVLLNQFCICSWAAKEARPVLSMPTRIPASLKEVKFFFGHLLGTVVFITVMIAPNSHKSLGKHRVS